MMISMAVIVRAAEGLPRGAVSGCEAEDVRDALVHLRARVSEMDKQVLWNDAPQWTLQDLYAVELMVRALRALGDEGDLWVAGPFVDRMEARLSLCWKCKWRKDERTMVDVLARMLGVVLVRKETGRQGNK
jgi:hypothetical protein